MSRSIAPRRALAAGAFCVATTGLAFLAVRVTAGEAMKVAEGRTAIWLDDHTLLVEA